MASGDAILTLALEREGCFCLWKQKVVSVKTAADITIFYTLVAIKSEQNNESRNTEVPCCGMVPLVAWPQRRTNQKTCVLGRRQAALSCDTRGRTRQSCSARRQITIGWIDLSYLLFRNQVAGRLKSLWPTPWTRPLEAAEMPHAPLSIANLHVCRLNGANHRCQQ